MSSPDEKDSVSITEMLSQARAGNRQTLDELFPIVYRELRRVAANQLAGERGNHTLQPTALVHEAYLKMIDQTNLSAENRSHFFGIAARMMRQILVDHAR